ncbi:MAG TPA: hypothetical protein VGN69_00155 [Solirubrobacteraceae bacterium]|jgi:hypothetical protein|nr:hypothetical protein [Solirubrobacteraceae bacterium]
MSQSSATGGDPPTTGNEPPGRGHHLIEDIEKGLHLHHHLSPRRERAMFAALGFIVALGLTRGITTFLHYRGAGANGGIVIGGVHVHHMAFGIIGLLLIGYMWLLLYGAEHQAGRRAFRITGFAYGAAAALILDEFALWLNLRDVYWEKQGRESVEALAFFAGLLLSALLIAPFLRAAWQHLSHRRR